MLWPIKKIDALIAAEQPPEKCWAVRRYLGSMLAFDFGHRIERSGRKGAYQIGSSRLGVRDVAWTVVGESFRFESDAADDETTALLTRRFAGASLAGCKSNPQWLSFTFDNGLQLRVDRSNRYAAEQGEVVLSLALRGGAVFEADAKGRFEMILADDPVSADAA